MTKKATTSKKAVSAPLLNGAEAKPTFKQKINLILGNYGYIGYAAAISALIIFLIYLARGLYPLDNGTVLVLDLNGQYVYFFEHLRESVLSGDFTILYSWSRAAGGEFMGIYAYYLASPLSYIVCLFPKEMMQEAILAMYLIKSAICGATMAFYLHKHSENTNRQQDRVSIIMFAVMYATCAYCVVYQNNIMWMDSLFWLPLLTLGIEELVKFGKYKLFVVSLALTLISNYYIGYMCCIYVAVYYFYYISAFKDNDVNNPCHEKNHFWRSLVRVATFSAVAIGIAAVLVLTAYYSLQFGKNEFSTPNWEISLRFDFFDLFYKLLPGSYDTVRPQGYPFVYCGVLTIMLAPVFFLSKKFTNREKIASLALICVFVFSFIISSLNLIWHGFQKPNWLNDRFSFMFSFFLVVLAYKAFGAIKEVGNKCLLAIAAVIGGFAMLLQKMSDSFFETIANANDDYIFNEFGTVVMTLICLAVYLSILAIKRRSKNRELVASVLLGIVCIEMFLNGLASVNSLGEDVGFTSHSKYSDYMEIMRPITETVQDNDKSFYRMEKTEHRKTNDNMALSMRGLSNSTSTLDADTIYFLRMMGYSSKSNWSKYLGGNPVGDSLMGIKYLITDRDYNEFYGEPVYTGKDFAAHEGISLKELIEKTKSDEYTYSKDNYKTPNSYVVYKNPYALSLAFASSEKVLSFNMKDENSYVKKDDERYNPTGYTSPFTRLNGLLSAITGETVEVFKPAKQNGDPKTNGCTSEVSSNHNKYKNTSTKDGTVTYLYTVPANTDLYLYLPAFYGREVDIKSNNQKIYDGSKTFGGNETNRIIELGRTEGTTYSFTVTIKSNDDLFYTKLDESFIYYVDKEALAETFTKIQSEQLVINEKYEENDISGTIKTTAANRVIMTTIPYDEGWRVYVDGKRVEISEALDTMLTFRIEDAGEHTVRLLYMPDSYVFGMIITVCSTAIFVLVIIFEKRLMRVAFIKKYFAPEYVPSKADVDSANAQIVKKDNSEKDPQ